MELIAWKIMVIALASICGILSSVAIRQRRRIGELEARTQGGKVADGIEIEGDMRLPEASIRELQKRSHADRLPGITGPPVGVFKPAKPLDGIAEIWGMERLAGEADPEFRSRIQIAIDGHIMGNRYL